MWVIENYNDGKNQKWYKNKAPNGLYCFHSGSHPLDRFL